MVRMERRPTTATLLKPAVLDTRLLGIFDMTTVSREHLLVIKNLVHATPRCKCKSTISMMKTFAMDNESGDEVKDDDANVQKVCKELNRTYRIRQHHSRSKLPKEYIISDNEEVSKKIPVIPVPCATCGRQNQPERFHSHPSRCEVKSKEILSTKKTEGRNTVQTPMPIKFRSAKTQSNNCKEPIKNNGNRVPVPHSRPTKDQQSSPKGAIKKQTAVKQDKENAKIKIQWKGATHKTQQPKHGDSNKVRTANFLRTPSYEAYKLDKWVPAPVSGDRKRKVVCYLCSQEFGTAVLPSHEAQCIRKYLKESADNIPVKDESDGFSNQNEISSSQSRDNWKIVWELTQTALIACKCCGRKFLPSRIEAHQKICLLNSSDKHNHRLARKSSTAVKASNTQSSSVSSRQLDMHVQCDAYDKWFTGLMISQQHEQIETSKKSNRALPKELSSLVSPVSPVSSADASRHNPPTLLDKSPKEFNEVKDDSDAFWKIHQAQLVPCAKCSRKFYPHRLEVHMRGCKGPSKRKMKPVKTMMS